MTKNSKHWKTMMARDIDRKVASEGRDPLEEGLEGLSWFETKKRNVKRRWAKTRETFGEEVGNSITSGVLCLYELFMLPFAAVLAYIKAPEGKGLTDAMTVSAFMVAAFLASLFTTIYHFLKHGTVHKRIFSKLDHIMVYYAILGVYTPLCFSLLNSAFGYVMFGLEAGLALAGTFFMAFAYPENKPISKCAVAIYGIMGLLGVFLLKDLHAVMTAKSFWLMLSGVIAYAVGLFFYSGKKFKFSHMVWHLIVVCATVCHVLAFVYFLR